MASPIGHGFDVGLSRNRFPKDTASAVSIRAGIHRAAHAPGRIGTPKCGCQNVAGHARRGRIVQHSRANRFLSPGSGHALSLAIAIAVVLPPVAAGANEARLSTTREGESSASRTTPVTQDEAEKSVRAMRDVIARVSKKIDEARKQRDALRLNCIDDKRNLMTGLLKVAQDALDEAKAVKNASRETVEHEFGRVVIAREKVDGYATEAEQCMGSVAFREGEGLERTFHDANENMPGDDPMRPEPVETSGYRPPPASPMH